MKIFLTGGGGFIGGRLTERLIAENHNVAVLLRNPLKTTWFDKSKVRIIKGDIFDNESLLVGMTGCDMVFHLAAFTDTWSEDPALPYISNVKGTINILENALRCGIKRFILTSTCGTLGYSENGKILDESSESRNNHFTVYEKTKAEAEKRAFEYCQKGIEVIVVNPSRLYGPGILTKGNSMTKIIKGYLNGTWRIIPSDGKAIGNYVFIDDVVNGHILAASKGIPGHRYILGGENLSFNELFDILGEVSGKKRIMIHFPRAPMKAAALLIEFISPALKIAPLITSNWIDKYIHDAPVSSDKAIKELGYHITTFRSGVQKTIKWLAAQGK